MTRLLFGFVRKGNCNRKIKTHTVCPGVVKRREESSRRFCILTKDDTRNLSVRIRMEIRSWNKLQLQMLTSLQPPFAT